MLESYELFTTFKQLGLFIIFSTSAFIRHLTGYMYYALAIQKQPRANTHTVKKSPNQLPSKWFSQMLKCFRSLASNFTEYRVNALNSRNRSLDTMSNLATFGRITQWWSALRPVAPL